MIFCHYWSASGLFALQNDASHLVFTLMGYVFFYAHCLHDFHKAELQFPSGNALRRLVR